MGIILMRMEGGGVIERGISVCWQFTDFLNTEIIYMALKPQDSFGRFAKKFLDLQKVDHTIRKHH